MRRQPLSGNPPPPTCTLLFNPCSDSSSTSFKVAESFLLADYREPGHFPAGLRLDTLLIKSQQSSGRRCMSCVSEAGGWCRRQAGRLIGHLVRCGWDLGSSLPTPAATPLPGLDGGRMMMLLLLFSVLSRI